MKKIILILILLIPLQVYSASIPELNSSKYVIYDITSDEILLEKDIEEKTSIASLTKIMTVLTAIENIEDLNKTVTITSTMLEGIYWNASVAGLKVGDIVTYKDLLYAAMLPSGADATNVLAYDISGSLSGYVTEMNNLASTLGLENTHFTNVIGLDSANHFSTVSDVLKLLKYALNNETFKEVYTTKEYYLTNGLLVSSSVSKFNEKMGLDIGRILGSKTGFTDSAGFCLSSYINSYDHELIIITLGAKRIDTSFYHIIDTLNLIEYSDELMKEKIAKEEEQKELQAVKEQEEKNRQEELEIKKKEIELNKKIIIIITISGAMLLMIICRPRKKRRKKHS